ncbi:MAG: hypothetical protein ACYC3X_25435 [Pirellulaceae bacterium]
MAKKCLCCRGIATRRCDDGLGGMVSLCGACFSPAEVLSRAAELRATWPRWRRLQGRREERHGHVNYGRVFSVVTDSGPVGE